MTKLERELLLTLARVIANDDISHFSFGSGTMIADDVKINLLIKKIKRESK